MACSEEDDTEDYPFPLTLRSGKPMNGTDGASSVPTDGAQSPTNGGIETPEGVVLNNVNGIGTKLAAASR